MSHEQQFTFLKKSAAVGKLSHAYIFSGNDTEAQKECALRISQYVNCEQQEVRPCATCKSCLAIERSQHPDVLEVEEGSKEITVAQIRNIQAHVQLTPWQSAWKIVIVRNAHLMNQEAQSALLKVVEEPTRNSLFLLTTTYPARLLATIRSRAQELPLYRFSQDTGNAAQEVAKLHALSVTSRFAVAKRIAETADNAAETTLETWLQGERALLLEALESKPEIVGKLCSNVRLMQDMAYALSQTNVNPRLALEKILLDIA